MTTGYLQKIRKKLPAACKCGRIFKSVGGLKQHLNCQMHWNMARKEWGQELDTSHGLETLATQQEGDNK